MKEQKLYPETVFHWRQGFSQDDENITVRFLLKNKTAHLKS